MKTVRQLNLVIPSLLEKKERGGSGNERFALSASSASASKRNSLRTVPQTSMDFNKGSAYFLK